MNEQKMRGKVIKGLECCTQHGSMSGRNCNGHWGYTDASHTRMELIGEYRAGCTYGNCETDCVKTLAKDALALLKAQEPRMMTLEEYKALAEKPKEERDPVWEEWPGLESTWAIPDQAYGGYGTSWRCWTSRPTDEQRKKEPWNG